MYVYTVVTCRMVTAMVLGQLFFLFVDFLILKHSSLCSWISQTVPDDALNLACRKELKMSDRTTDQDFKLQFRQHYILQNPCEQPGSMITHEKCCLFYQSWVWRQRRDNGTF